MSAMSPWRAARTFMAKRWRGDAATTVRPGRSRSAVNVRPGREVGGRLLVKPPGREAQLGGHYPCLGHDGAVVAPDRGVEVHGRVPGVVGEDHGSAAEEVQLGVDPPALKVMRKAFERLLQQFAAEQGPVHARARS